MNIYRYRIYESGFRCFWGKAGFYVQALRMRHMKVACCLCPVVISQCILYSIGILKKLALRAIDAYKQGSFTGK